jgi:hypothetical protein
MNHARHHSLWQLLLKWIAFIHWGYALSMGVFHEPDAAEWRATLFFVVLEIMLVMTGLSLWQLHLGVRPGVAPLIRTEILSG